MMQPSESRDQEIASALRQLTAEHQQGRLSLSRYRQLRHALLEKIDKGEEIVLLHQDRAVRARPGIVVWIAIAGIVLLLAMLGWLFR